MGERAITSGNGAEVADVTDWEMTTRVGEAEGWADGSGESGERCRDALAVEAVSVGAGEAIEPGVDRSVVACPRGSVITNGISASSRRISVAALGRWTRTRSAIPIDSGFENAGSATLLGMAAGLDSPISGLGIGGEIASDARLRLTRKVCVGGGAIAADGADSQRGIGDIGARSNVGKPARCNVVGRVGVTKAEVP